MQNKECAFGHSYTVQTPISKFKALHLSIKYRKVREVRKIIVLSVLKNRYCTVQLRSEAVFLFFQLTAINPLMHTLYVCPFLSVIVFSLQDTRPPPLSFFKNGVYICSLSEKAVHVGSNTKPPYVGMTSLPFQPSISFKAERVCILNHTLVPDVTLLQCIFTRTKQTFSLLLCNSRSAVPGITLAAVLS